MERYVGLDVSLKQTSICVVNQAGSIVQEGLVDSDPKAIAAFVRSKGRERDGSALRRDQRPHGCGLSLKRLGLPVIASTRAVPRRCSRCRSIRATATMRPASPASCRPAGSKRCVLRISTATPSRRCWRAGRCWSLNHVSGSAINRQRPVGLPLIL
jgi:hypothetical protein